MNVIHILYHVTQHVIIIIYVMHASLYYNIKCKMSPKNFSKCSYNIKLSGAEITNIKKHDIIYLYNIQ
jgi:hypothetical protein